MFGRVEEGFIRLPLSEKECRGKNYKIIENKFHDLGFNNIEITRINDLKFDIFKKADRVELVTIAGSDKFKKNQVVDLNSLVRITYHSKMGEREEVVNAKDFVFKGKWIQCHGNKEYTYYASIEESSITVYIKYAAEEVPKLYWAGTFNIDKFTEEKIIIVSRNKQALTHDSVSALHCYNKEFAFENGRLSFESNYINDKSEIVVLTKSEE